MNENDALILQCSLFAHFDDNVYSPEYVLEKALMCKQVGVSAIHVHLSKFKTIDDFFRFAQLLEDSNGPLITLSANDVETAIKYDASDYKSIAIASVQGGSATVFGTHIYQTMKKTSEEIEKLLQNGIIPEVSVFNFESIKNCISLYNKFNRKFYVGVYMGYPGGMDASKINIEKVMELLKKIPMISFTIYNNQNDELIKFIVERGGHLRSGLEDTMYCGNVAAVDSIEIMKYLNRLIEASGMRRAKTFDKNSFRDYMVWS